MEMSADYSAMSKMARQLKMLNTQANLQLIQQRLKMSAESQDILQARFTLQMFTTTKILYIQAWEVWAVLSEKPADT